MPKSLKILLAFAGFCVAFLLLVTLALRLFLPAAKIRRIAEEQIRRQLNREAQLGDVHLGLRGLTIRQFKLSDPPSLAQGGTFLEVEKVSLRWALMPLLTRTLLLQAITLEKPRVRLVRKANGKFLNMTDLAAASSSGGAQSPAAQPAPPVHKSSWSWAVQKVQLKNGVVRFEDLSTAQMSSTLSDIDLVIRDFDPTKVQGQLTVRQLQNPVYTAQDFYLNASLQDIDPTLGKVNGSMQLQQGKGLVQNLERLANSSQGTRLALMPVVMLQNLDGRGLVNLGLPDFRRLDIERIDGRYTFKKGTMHIDSFKIDSRQAAIGASGTIELASGKLAVDVSLHTPEPVLAGEMDLKMSVGGTLANPKANLDHLKKRAFKATIKQLSNPETQKQIENTFKNIFR